MKFENWLFMPGHTIEAIIRMKNDYVHGDQLKNLVSIFNEKNENRVPSVGQNFFIPVLEDEDKTII